MPRRSLRALAGHRGLDRLHRGRQAPGQAPRRRRPVPGRPLRRAARRGAALAGAPAGAALDRRPRRYVLWKPLCPAPQRQRAAGGHRRLPVPQRLRPGGPPRSRRRTRSGRARAAGPVHDPRWRPGQRGRRSARRLADRQDRPHHRGVHQLPAGRVRLPGRAGPGHHGAHRERQLRPARPGSGAGLGAPQHRPVRGEPGSGHDRRGVGGRLVRLRADDLAAGPRPVPRRDQ